MVSLEWWLEFEPLVGGNAAAARPWIAGAWGVMGVSTVTAHRVVCVVGRGQVGVGDGREGVVRENRGVGAGVKPMEGVVTWKNTNFVKH